jgi:hypothetical protein
VDGLATATPALERIVASGALATDPFVLLDVGCGLGLDRAWRRFAPHLRACGVDPQVREIERLTSEELDPNVRFLAAFVGLPDDHPWKRRQRADAARDRPYYYPFGRSSAMAIAQRQPPPAEAETPLEATQHWQAQRLASETLALDALVERQGIRAADFLKVDTDGHDLEVLVSARQLLRTGGVLGVLIETPFQGSPTHTSNSMHNIDRELRRLGFSLFGLTINRYTRAALPGTFLYNAPYQTVTGQPIWGDFLYFRDAAAADYASIWETVLPPTKVLKLVSLFELFNLPDCAAELVVAHRDTLAALADPDELLNLLTPALGGTPRSYTEYLAVFEQDYTKLYPR